MYFKFISLLIRLTYEINFVYLQIYLPRAVVGPYIRALDSNVKGPWFKSSQSVIFFPVSLVLGDPGYSRSVSRPADGCLGWPHSYCPSRSTWPVRGLVKKVYICLYTGMITRWGYQPIHPQVLYHRVMIFLDLARRTIVHHVTSRTFRCSDTIWTWLFIRVLVRSLLNPYNSSEVTCVIALE